MYSYFWATFKSIPFQAKTALATFWHLLEKFGLLFNSASGHTPREREREREKNKPISGSFWATFYLGIWSHSTRERERQKQTD